VVVSLRATGACEALIWKADDARYRCGLIEQPLVYLPAALQWAAPLVAKIAHRYISAGTGCDSSADITPR
jgi:hypothetical protein